jgi:hypothetical protein
MIRYLKKNSLVVLLIMLLLFGAGICFFLPAAYFFRVFAWISFSYLIVMGCSMIYLTFRYYNNLRQGSFLDFPGYLIYGLFLIIFGILSLLYPEYLVRIIIGITFIIFPTWRILESKDKKEALSYQFWKYIVGIIFVLSTSFMIKFIFVFIGIAFLVIAIYLSWLLIKQYRNNNQNLLQTFILRFIYKNKED